jgi:hypothetical protein|tara:strand:- start:52 stop:261 length:210 start_codon:yes stop_codon:yes gene_type:complete
MTDNLNIQDAKEAYIKECHEVGAMPRMVTYMTFDKISELYTIGNTKDGDIADLQPNGFVQRMHWNKPKS